MSNQDAETDRPGPTRQNTSLDYFEKLLSAYGNLEFECGAWDREDSKPYRELWIGAQAARRDVVKAYEVAMLSKCDPPICERHGFPMPMSVGWYGVKFECKHCLMEGHTPNGKN